MDRRDMSIADVLVEWWGVAAGWLKSAADWLDDFWWGHDTAAAVLTVLFVIVGVIGSVMGVGWVVSLIFQEVPPPAFSGTVLDKACYEEDSHVVYQYNPALKQSLPQRRVDPAYCVLVLGYSDDEAREYRVQVVDVPASAYEQAVIGEWYEQKEGE